VYPQAPEQGEWLSQIAQNRPRQEIVRPKKIAEQDRGIAGGGGIASFGLGRLVVRFANEKPDQRLPNINPATTSG
jgi:hypothetical protein